MIHNQLVALESRFQKDLHSLETKYAKEFYAPLLKLRSRLLEASKALNICDQFVAARGYGQMRMWVAVYWFLLPEAIVIHICYQASVCKSE